MVDVTPQSFSFIKEFYCQMWFVNTNVGQVLESLASYMMIFSSGHFN